MSRTRPKPVVYFIQENVTGELHRQECPHCKKAFLAKAREGNIKIGTTAGPVHTRLSGIQVGNPNILSCIGTMEGGEDKEREMHEYFGEYNIRGRDEWFLPSPEIKSFVKTLPKRQEDTSGMYEIKI